MWSLYNLIYGESKKNIPDAPILKLENSKNITTGPCRNMPCLETLINQEKVSLKFLDWLFILQKNYFSQAIASTGQALIESSTDLFS